MAELNIFTDGGARGNPGPAAIALLIFDGHGKPLFSHAEYIGIATNNVAEYRAVLKALVAAKGHGKGPVICTMDSLLVASQLSGKYKVKEPALKELFAMVKEAEKRFTSVEYRHVSRTHDKIRLADSMLNLMLDKVGRQSR